MSVEDVTEILAVHLLGAIPDDEKIVIGTNQGEPVIGLDSIAGKAYFNICRRLLGEDIPFLNLDSNSGLFTKLTRIFQKH